MRLALRVLLLLVVFAGVGWFAAHVVVSHAAANTPESQVRLSAATAGLFAGGAAAVLVGIAMLRIGRKG
jgi:purine-cytosine permease-like protein